jgi:PII-like signaling protein
MELQGEAKLLRIFLGESDKVGRAPLHDVILREARAAGLAGATAWRGTGGFGASSRMRTAGVLDLSGDLPLVIEITDQEEKIDRFLPKLRELFETSRGGGLVTMEKVQVIHYLPGAGAPPKP